MSDANWLWPIDGKSFYDINNNNYLVHIDWSKNSKEDYQKLSQDFFECGYKICEKIVDSGHDNIKSDMWFFPTMYLFRHGMELGLKALICGAISEKRKIQQIFLDCKHDLYMLFDAYERETAILLTEEEYGWMKKYLHSLEEVDAKSDFFRFPLEDEFLLNYQNKFLDIVDMAREELAKPQPKVSRLRNCIALIAPMMTIANGIPTLSSNLQKFGEFIMNYIK